MDDILETNQTSSPAEESKPSVSTVVLTGYLYLLMAAFAISITMIGPMMALIIDEYQLRLSQGGLIITAQSIGGIIAIITAGIVADLFRKSRLVAGAFLTFALVLLTLRLASTFPVLLLLFFMLGAGTRMLDTVLNAYISDLHSHNRGLYLNLLHTFFGVGAFIGPIFTRFLLAREIPWNQVFSTLGLAAMGILLFYPLVLSKAGDIHSRGQKAPKQPYRPLVRSPFVWILGCIMILYVGHQSSIVVWLPMYMETTLFVDPTLSSLALSVFWIGIIAGRLLCSYLSKRYSERSLLLWGGLLGGITLVAGFALQHPVFLVLCLGLTGFFTGATIPLLVTIACNHYPSNSGTVSSIIFLCGTFSTMVFPWFVGTIAELASFHWAMLLTGFLFFIIVLFGSRLPKE